MHVNVQSFMNSLRGDVQRQLEAAVFAEGFSWFNPHNDHAENLAFAVYSIQSLAQLDPLGVAVQRYFESKKLPYFQGIPVVNSLAWLYAKDPEAWEDLVRSVAKSVCDIIDNETPDFYLTHPEGQTEPRQDAAAVRELETFLAAEFNLPKNCSIKMDPIKPNPMGWNVGGSLLWSGTTIVFCNVPPRPVGVFFTRIKNRKGGGHFVHPGIPFGKMFAERVMRAIVDCYWPGTTIAMTDELNRSVREKNLLREDSVESGESRFFNLSRLQDPAFRFPVVDGREFNARVVKLSVSPGGKSWETIEFTGYANWTNVAGEAIDLFEKAANYARLSWHPVSAVIELDLGERFRSHRNCMIELTRTRCNLDQVPLEAREDVRQAIRRWGLESPRPFTVGMLSDILRFPNTLPRFGLSELGGAESVWLSKPQDGSDPVFKECGDAPGVLCPCGCGHHAPVKDLIATCPTSGKQFRVSKIELKQYELDFNALAAQIARAIHPNGVAELKEDGSYRLGPRRFGEKEVFFISRPTMDLLASKFKDKVKGAAVVAGCSNPPAFDGLAIRPMTDFFDDDFIPDEGRIVEFLTAGPRDVKLDQFGEADKNRSKVVQRHELLRSILWSCYRWRRDQFNKNNRLPKPLTKTGLMSVLATRMLFVNLPSKEKEKWNERYTLVVERRGRVRKGKEKEDDRLLNTYLRELNRDLSSLKGGENEDIDEPGTDKKRPKRKVKKHPLPKNDSAECIEARKLWDACVASDNDFFRASEALESVERDFRRRSMPTAEDISSLTAFADGGVFSTTNSPTPDPWNHVLGYSDDDNDD